MYMALFRPRISSSVTHYKYKEAFTLTHLLLWVPQTRIESVGRYHICFQQGAAGAALYHRARCDGTEQQLRCSCGCYCVWVSEDYYGGGNSGRNF